MANFSLIIPTYSGASTINKTFKSIFEQKKINASYEIVVVIDGPNVELTKIVAMAAKDFRSKNIDFKIEQFNKNKGRFEARIAGAKLAKYQQLLFVDDRVHLQDDYFKVLESTNEPVVMTNVSEVTDDKTSVISKTMFLIRRRLYGKKFGTVSNDYYIDKSNFESSPKGTTSLWIDKDIFLTACKAVSNAKSSKYVNEDTKILRAVVEAEYKIFRPSKLVVYYKPRVDFKSASVHLYERGPRFVDYYLKPGTRFFPIIVIIYLLPILIILSWLLSPPVLRITLFGALTSGILAAAALARTTKEFLTALIGLPLIGIFFTAGVYKGMFLKLKEAFSS